MHDRHLRVRIRGVVEELFERAHLAAAVGADEGAVEEAAAVPPADVAAVSGEDGKSQGADHLVCSPELWR